MRTGLPPGRTATAGKTRTPPFQDNRFNQLANGPHRDHQPGSTHPINDIHHVALRTPHDQEDEGQGTEADKDAPLT